MNDLFEHWASVDLIRRKDQGAEMRRLFTKDILPKITTNSYSRLAMSCAARIAIRFEPDSPLPDPYDGLIEAQPGEHLAVHDCMGMPLFIEGEIWGVVTLDALTPGNFTEQQRLELQRCALVIEAMLRMSRLEQDNKALRQGRQDDEPMERKLYSAVNIIGHNCMRCSINWMS